MSERYGYGWTDPRGVIGTPQNKRYEALDEGPYGLYDIRFYTPDDVVVAPARVRTGFVERKKLEGDRHIHVFDEASASLADAKVREGSDIPAASQWLLDMVSVRLGL